MGATAFSGSRHHTHSFSQQHLAVATRMGTAALQGQGSRLHLAVTCPSLAYKNTTKCKMAGVSHLTYIPARRGKGHCLLSKTLLQKGILSYSCDQSISHMTAPAKETGKSSPYSRQPHARLSFGGFMNRRVERVYMRGQLEVVTS